MLPSGLRRLGFDPATSSVPFVATLVDVTGLIVYFTVSLAVLRGTLLCHPRRLMDGLTLFGLLEASLPCWCAMPSKAEVLASCSGLPSPACLRTGENGLEIACRAIQRGQGLFRNS
jgi:hypothetical protein